MPSKLGGKKPTHGVSLHYVQLTNQELESLQLEQLQDEGYLFIWVIQSTASFCIKWLEEKGYKWMETITWVKVGDAAKLQQTMGPYFLRAAEHCYMFRKGRDLPNVNKQLSSTVILAPVREQSRKPDEL